MTDLLQVHLICMPPGGDNICDKSADYHFVNDFLYKPLNLDEYQQKPNVTLKYSDRYYPDNYRPRYEEEDEAPIQHQHSVSCLDYFMIGTNNTTI